MQALRRDDGFTLVELMMVTVVIGILVSMAVPVYASTETTASRKACFANQRLLEGAAAVYETVAGNVDALENAAIDGSDPLTKPDAEGRHYIKSAPKCPGSHRHYRFGADGRTVLSDNYGGGEGWWHSGQAEGHAHY